MNTATALIRDLSFEVAGARLSAILRDPYWCDIYNEGEGKELFWLLQVSLRPREVAEERWIPSFYNEALCFPIHSWKEVAGQSVSWTEPFDETTGEANGGFYVYEHGDIPRATLRFGQRVDALFSFSWEGVCEIHWSEPYKTDVPFAVNAQALFDGITVQGNENDTPQTMSRRLADHLALDDLKPGAFEPSSHNYESGVGMASQSFAPNA